MKLLKIQLELIALVWAFVLPFTASAATKSYLSSADQKQLLSTETALWQQPLNKELPLLQLKAEQQFQQMDGFGYTLTGGSAMHLMGLTAENRNALLQELFGAQGLAVSYLRISIGASDLDPEPFSYNDLAEGQQDPELKQFSIKPDEKYLIPVLKQILAINPKIKLLGSPWSPPAWMKSNNSTIGGELLEQHFGSYALYFVKYIQAMQQQGIHLDAVTVQNEPLHPGNNPSLLMHARDQANFIKNHLGPAFKKAGLDTKIIIYDHNTDHIEYPIAVLNDKEAKPYIDGSAFHLYNGSIEELDKLKQAHPDKNIYFTEQWVGANSDFNDSLMWHIEHLIIGAPRHWARNVLQWNLSSDAKLQPHTKGGCSLCLGALTIEGQQVKRNVAYYIIAHATKVVPQGSVRIDSVSTQDIRHVAYLRPNGRYALIVQNITQESKGFNLQLKGALQPYSVQLPPRTVLSLVL
ncbi:glycoside hydrolase family 30 protein [Rheinheimera tangshanensis]|uniref:Glucosylceramidase n=1 Tax=Rheinheimera tangshanensis TaxID=400153 RepID=A0A5C8LV20_9GAMM|nr:glycoside hydrolase family 30 beta sandwich domain-containing protein [Rheinheimera tangshanensis]TXK80577.1 glucosylceramidase [Rheinheimera tangshanensis]GGM60164.1 glucosylceramidase [Rheinheimera tangshanensis]